MLRKWQVILQEVEAEAPLPEDVHPHLEDYEIVEPPDEGEDSFQAHGGNDVCMDVEDAPERDEAQGEEVEASSEEYESSDEPSKDAETSEETENSSSLNETSEDDEAETPSDEPETDSNEASEDDTETSAESEEADEPSEDDSEYDDAETDSDDDYYEEDEDNYADYQHNQAFDLEYLRKKRLESSFASIISKVAEDLSGWPIEGDDEWNVNAIMERRITRRPLYSCRQSRERESVVLILDTSGSCSYLSEFFSNIANAAINAGDVELYTAPNAWIEKRYHKGGWEKIIDNKDDTFGWERFSNRTIIFFGDFDGGNAPVLASYKNKVYWFSCETRYSDMDEHNWCSFKLKNFKGFYFPCTSEEDFFRLVRKVR